MTRILIIEDEPTIRNNMADILEYEGYSVLRAENGIAGVEFALTFLPDLILCDVMMPELDGYGVLSALREQPTTSSIPFIFLTAKADPLAVRHGMELGADDYLSKPHTMPELLAAVSTRLEKRASIDRLHQQSFDALRMNLIRALPHEFRTPLYGILGNAQLICLDYETLERKDILHMTEGIISSGERLQHLIENYFLYAQIELAMHDAAARAAFANGQVEMPEALIREIALAKAVKSERRNDLFVQAEDAVIRISDQSLWKILEELVDNAFKFSRAGTKIEITGASDGRTYRLQISDQGRGMTTQQIQNIGAYAQFERKLYEQQGMGMGLIVAKRLVELCDGQLTVVSEPERGTTVTVELPVSVVTA